MQVLSKAILRIRLDVSGQYSKSMCFIARKLHTRETVRFYPAFHHLAWNHFSLKIQIVFFWSFIRAWNHCDSIQDYLSIFDGKSNEFPELARVCGGDSLPDIISSGPDMLIVFQTSPFDSLFHPTPVSYLLGFELEVEVS